MIDNNNFHDDEDEENQLITRRERSSLKSLDYVDNNDKKKADKKKKEEHEEHEGEGEDEGEGDKQLHSNILFKSHNEFESGEGGKYEVGLETLNIIEHIDMLNSAAGTLLTKNGKNIKRDIELMCDSGGMVN